MHDVDTGANRDSPQELLTAEQDRRLNHGLPSTVGLNVVLAGLLIFEHRGVVADSILLGWAIVLGLLLLLRVSLWPFGPRGDQPAIAADWRRLYVTATALVALAWGGGAWLLFAPDHPGLQMLLTVAMVGLGTGALIQNLPAWRVVWFYSVCLLLPLIVHFHRASSEIALTVLVLLLLFLGAVWIFSRQLAGMFAEQVRLRREQQERADAEHLQRVQFKSLIESTRAVLWEADPETLAFHYISPEVEQLLGYPARDWLDSPTFWADHIHPEDQGWAVEYCMRCVREHRAHSFDYRMVAADGRTVWIRDVVNVVSENGRVARLGGVIIDITTLKETTANLQYVSGLQSLMVDISRSLIQPQRDSLDDLLDSILERTGRWCGADRAYFLRFDDDRTRFTNTHEWVADGIEPQLAHLTDVPTSTMPKLMVQLMAHHQVSIPDVSSLPDDWGEERAMLAEQDIQSLIVLPVFVGERLTGMVGFDSVRSPRDFIDEEGALLRVLGDLLGEAMARDEADRDLRASEARRRDVERLAAMGGWSWDPAADRIEVSDECARVLGVAPGSVDRHRWLAGIEGDQRAGVRHALEAALRDGTAFDAEFRWARPDGGERIWVRAHAERFEAGVEANTLRGYVQDITVSREAEEALYRQARYDSLTGLPNRILLHERLSGRLLRARHGKAGDVRVAVLVLDLDHFKKVNETLGHGAGDRLLVDAGQRLAALVGDRGMVARAGGDEFLVLVDALAAAESPACLADEIVASFRAPFRLGGRDLVLTVSIGLAVSPDHGRRARDLVRNADTAMYRAKEQGRDGHCVFDPAMTDALRRQLELEQALRGALEREEITVHYQPLVRLADGVLRGVEALMRWHHPTFGAVRPDEFIGIAEQIGLIDALGEYLFGRAVRDLARWRAVSGLALTVAINVSPRQFRDPRFASRLLAMIDAAGLPPDAVHIEITEGVLLAGIEGVRSILHELIDHGVGVVMDDFGTGYSSLSYLRDYPFSVVKIDQRFIRDVDTDAQARQLVVSVIRLGQALGMDVVAEGVETEGQMQVLIEEGCGFGQGFLFSPPVPSPDIDRWLADGECGPFCHVRSDGQAGD